MLKRCECCEECDKKIAKALRLLARWLTSGSKGDVPADSIQAGLKIAAAEALYRAKTFDGARKRGRLA